MKTLKTTLIGLAAVICSQFILNGAISLPAPSPLQVINQKIGYSDVTLTYSRPVSRGRDIFGQLVPYDILWRTGANSATILEFTTDATIGGKTLPAGKYSLLTIPGKKQWTVILNSKTEDFGPPAGYEPDLDVVRFTAEPEKLSDSVEELTFQFTDLGYDGANLRLTWEKTAVDIPIAFDTHTLATAEIEKLLNHPEGAEPWEFMVAASYYFYADKNASEALEMVDAFIEKSENPPYWAIYLKAEILAKLGKSDEAIATAEKVIEIAKNSGGEVWGPKYVRWAENLIKQQK